MKKAFSRLKTLFQSERGHVLAIGAATLPLLMGSAGFAIDAAQMAMWKRQMQRAADSAAIAGAHARVQGASTDSAVANDVDEHIDYDLEENETPMLKGDPEITTGSFGAGAMSETQSCQERGLTGPNCWDDAVQVALVAERRLPFMGMFTRSATELNARATAAVVQTGEYCMVSLYEGEDPGIISGGNSNLDLECGMATNARGSKAIDAYGSAMINADPAGAVGGISGTSKFTSGTVLLPYTSPIKDPFWDVPDPVLPSNCGGTLSIPNSVGTSTTPHQLPAGENDPKCWTNWDIQGHLKLAPGTYFVNNGLLDIKGSLSGEGVTLVLMGDNSSWTQNGGGKLSLTAPTSGDYEGIVIFRERTASSAANKEIKLNGGADLFLQGSIYGKNTDFWIGGNASLNAQCIQIVGRKLEFKGGGHIQNNCAGTGAEAFVTRTVKLVG